MKSKYKKVSIILILTIIITSLNLYFFDLFYWSRIRCSILPNVWQRLVGIMVIITSWPTWVVGILFPKAFPAKNVLYFFCNILGGTFWAIILQALWNRFRIKNSRARKVRNENVVKIYMEGQLLGEIAFNRYSDTEIYISKDEDGTIQLHR